MQWPGMIGGFGGLVLGICLLRRRSALGFAAVVLALLAFAFLAAAGLAIIARYTMLAGAILSIFFALALLGWRFLEPRQPLAPALADLRRDRPRDGADLAAEPVEPRPPGPHRPDQPGQDRGRPHRPRQRRRLLTGTAGRSRCRTTAPSRASPSASK